MKKTVEHPPTGGKKKLIELDKKLKTEREARLRLAAEYANFQKRVAEQEKKVSHRAAEQLLEKLFPVFDNFYRASTHAPEVALEDIPNLSEDDFKRIANYFAGLKMIEKQMEQVLTESGLRRIPTVGHEFDPNLHEAVSHEDSSGHPADSIIAEVESGWMLNGKALRPAKVRVSKG